MFQQYTYGNSMAIDSFYQSGRMLKCNQYYRYFDERRERIRTNPGVFIFSVPCLRVRAGGFVVSWLTFPFLICLPRANECYTIVTRDLLSASKAN